MQFTEQDFEKEKTPVETNGVISTLVKLRYAC